MLAAGGTYQNNLVFMMAFLFLSLGLVAILQTARNVRDIEIAHIEIEPNFPGVETDVFITLKNPTPDIKLQLEVRFELDQKKFRFRTASVPGKSFTEIRARLKLPNRRGFYPVRRIGIYTTFPYSLFTAWKYSKKTNEVIVFPQPIGQDLRSQFSNIYGEDFSGHKSYETGDRPSRIDWKVFARSQTYHVRQFNDGNEKEIHLHWTDLPPGDFEAMLSQMSKWILLAETQDIHYDVVLPRFQSPVGHGERHFKFCMEALTRTN